MRKAGVKQVGMCTATGINHGAAFPTIAIVTAPSPCHVWGAEDHRIIALIAANELTPAAKRHVQQLLGTDDAAAGTVTVSTSADEIRRQSRLFGFHDRVGCNG